MVPPSKLHKLGGEGPNVLLVHGFGADRFGWAANAPFLMPHASVWAVDLPGHGSAANHVGGGDLATLTQSVVGVIGELDGPLTVVGHSLGGRITLELLREESINISSVIALAPAGMGGDMNAEFLTQFPELGTNAEAQALLVQLVERERLISPAMADHVLQSLKSDGRRDALKLIAANILELRPIAVSPDASIKIFWGENDKIASPPTAEMVGANLTLLPNIGHLAHVEAASTINKAILECVGQ